jgi:hypothetical protein
VDSLNCFPETRITGNGEVSKIVTGRGVTTFRDAARYIFEMPYGYNSSKENGLILFEENRGSCTTKHAAFVMLAEELGIPVFKHIGIYAMTEEIVTGTGEICTKYGLPFIPMLHCFLVYGEYRVDLTEGNNNGKNCPIDDFIHDEQVIANVQPKEEYMILKKTLREIVIPDLDGIDERTLLKAREEGLVILKNAIK